MIDMSQRQLARAAGISLSTVVDFERKRRSVSPKSIWALRSALEAAGIVFIDQNDDGGPGVRLATPIR